MSGIEDGWIDGWMVGCFYFYLLLLDLGQPKKASLKIIYIQIFNNNTVLDRESFKS